MKYRKNVYQSFMMVMQFGINMIVPIFMCTALGVYIGKKLSIKWIVIPFFMAGALAGFRNIFMMAKRIYSNKEKDAKKD